jgi:hypothetical protein
MLLRAKQGCGYFVVTSKQAVPTVLRTPYRPIYATAVDAACLTAN